MKMMERVTELDVKTYDSFIAKGKVIVYFWAEWCGPCKFMGPIFKDVSAERKDIKFGKVDVDSESELAQRFHVMSIPTLIYFKDKEQVNRTVGAMSKEDFEAAIEESF